jgi:TonB family protein
MLRARFRAQLIAALVLMASVPQAQAQMLDEMKGQERQPCYHSAQHSAGQSSALVDLNDAELYSAATLLCPVPKREGLHSVLQAAAASVGFAYRTLTNGTSSAQPNRALQLRGSPSLWLDIHALRNAAGRTAKLNAASVNLRVNEDGRVIRCTMLKSTGFARADNEICTRIISRARFIPATDASGYPIAVSHVMTIPAMDLGLHYPDYDSGFD